MSFRRLAGHTIVYGVGDILLFGISYLAIIPLLTRHLSPQEYGTWATLTSVSVFLFTVFQLGLPSAAFRYYFEHKVTGDHETFLGTIWITSLVLAFLMAGILTLTGQSLWRLVIRNAEFQTYAGYVIWGAFFQVVIAFKSFLLRAQNRPKLFITLDLLQFLVFLVLIYHFVVTLDQGVIGQVRAAFLTYGIFGLVSGGILLRNTRMRIRRNFLPDCFRFAFPILLGYIVVFLATRVNVIIMQYFVAGSAVGIFAVGQQLGNVVQMAFSGFEKAWQPHFYDQRVQEARLLLARILRVAAPLAMCLTLVFALFAPEIVRVLTTSAYGDSWIVLVVIAVSSMFLALSSVVNWGLYYAHRSGLSTMATTAGALINIALCIYLAPRWGGIGAASSGLVSSICILVLTAAATSRAFSVQVEWGEMIHGLTVGVLAIVCVHLLCGWGVGFPPYLSVVFRILAFGLYATYALCMINKRKDRDVGFLRYFFGRNFG